MKKIEDNTRKETINGITKTVREWAKEVGVDEDTMYSRFRRNLPPEELLRPKGTWKPNVKFNEHYFDYINDEHKAYWLGFIWCDGYLGIRNRNGGNVEYNLKLSLCEKDDDHLRKFNDDIKGNYKIHYYKSGKSSFKVNNIEARLFITNKHLGLTLSEKYGMIPHRTDCSKVLAAIPENLMKHFIRGILDADGNFCKYNSKNKKTQKGEVKFNIQIGANTELVKKIEEYLIRENVINDYKRKLYKRHKDRDGDYITLYISGANQTIGVLNLLYKDATIYLNRKFDKYIEIVNFYDRREQ